MWEELHGAHVVYIARPYSDEDAVNYMCKDLIKEYPVTSKLGFPAMTSHGWLPKNAELVDKIILKAARYAINNSSDPDKKRIWKKVEDTFLAWATGESTLPMRINKDNPFIIKNQKVIMLNGGEYDLKEFGIITNIVKAIK